MASKDHARLDELQRDPYPLYARARGSEGLTFVPELDAWLVARDADVREVLRRPEEFSSVRALLPDVMPSPAALEVLAKGYGKRPTVVSTDGPAHQRHRAPLNRGLSAGRIAALVPYAAECAEALAEGFAADDGVERHRGPGLPADHHPAGHDLRDRTPRRCDRVRGVRIGQPRREPLRQARRLRHHPSGLPAACGLRSRAHGCPGSQLAREQLRLTIELFARRLPGLRLDEDKPPVVMRPTLIHRTPEALHLVW